jgi:hypothetical protein
VEGEGLVVGGGEPPSELPQVPDHRLAGVEGEVMLSKKLPQEGGLVLADRDR